MGVIMIRCPRTGHNIPTGIEMGSSDFQRAPVFFARVQCPICGGEHEWFAKDAWVSEEEDWAGDASRVSPRQLALSGRL
jgi:hypothetical protein